MYGSMQQMSVKDLDIWQRNKKLHSWRIHKCKAKNVVAKHCKL